MGSINCNEYHKYTVKIYFKFSFSQKKIKRLLVFLSLTVIVTRVGISACVSWSTDGNIKKVFCSSQLPDRIHDGITGIFHGINPSGHALSLGSTQPRNRNEYQEYFRGRKGQSVRRGDNLATFICRLSSFRQLQPLGALRACLDLYELLYFLRFVLRVLYTIIVNFSGCCYVYLIF